MKVYFDKVYEIVEILDDRHISLTLWWDEIKANNEAKKLQQMADSSPIQPNGWKHVFEVRERNVNS
jgi:hypothetical protein